ncbi:MAG: S8 family serine peptidase [Nitrospirota bacterium]
MKGTINIFICMAFILCIAVTAENSWAVTLNVTPNPAIVGQNVNINATANFLVTPCPININFGDGTPVYIQNCTVTPCTATTTHIYTTPGTFTVTAGAGCGTAPPDPVSTLLFVQLPPVTVNVTPVPSSFRIARGQSSAHNVSYQFRGTSSLNIPLTSPEGIFTVGNEIIGTVPIPFTVNIQNGSGLIAETVNIPAGIIERALQNNSTAFAYTRTFSNAQTSATATVLFTITTEAGADFALKRIELYFDNRRPEITVARNYPKLRAFAAIRFTGSGLLQGYWEVDGRLLSTVNQHLVYAKDVLLETPEIPPLPTFDPGSHIVRFVITSPSTAIPLPSIVYFVTPGETIPIPAKIKLIAPAHEAKIKYAPERFLWEPLDATAVYLIQYFDKPGSKPIFSAYTIESSYSLPQSVFNTVFSPGQKYSWKVTGFKDEKNIRGESEIRSFTFQDLPDHIQGQIMAVFAESTFSGLLVNELKEKFSFTLLDTFPIKALNLMVVIFETKDDIFPIINALGKDSRVSMAQPNFIFRTMSDPKRRVQYSNDIMQIDRIHESLKGHGIAVAVIDTGVDMKHEDLKDMVIYAENFIKGKEYVPEIHGTAVAGIIAAGVNGMGIEGIAPGAHVLALRACRQISSEASQGECYSDSIAKAMDKAIGQNAHIVNMSFGTARHDNLISKLIGKGTEHGIMFVAPSGNLVYEKSLRFPASHPSVISVGGLDEQMKPYPNAEITSKTTVSAPAVNILTTVPVNKYNFISGTSISSAFISGVLAVALEKDKGITKDKLPVFKGDICAWEEELLKLSLCEK